ncbi:MAG: hypothetical protein HQK53_07250 [Oligoflexia bacterium]|nr:hypothetical protein [Oligoflexia bacterium]
MKLKLITYCRMMQQWSWHMTSNFTLLLLVMLIVFPNTYLFAAAAGRPQSTETPKPLLALLDRLDTSLISIAQLDDGIVDPSLLDRIYNLSKNDLSDALPEYTELSPALRKIYLQAFLNMMERDILGPFQKNENPSETPDLSGMSTELNGHLPLRPTLPLFNSTEMDNRLYWVATRVNSVDENKFHSVLYNHLVIEINGIMSLLSAQTPPIATPVLGFNIATYEGDVSPEYRTTLTTFHEEGAEGEKKYLLIGYPGDCHLTPIMLQKSEGITHVFVLDSLGGFVPPNSGKEHNDYRIVISMLTSMLEISQIKLHFFDPQIQFDETSCPVVSLEIFKILEYKGVDMLAFINKYNRTKKVYQPSGGGLFYIYPSLPLPFLALTQSFVQMQSYLSIRSDDTAALDILSERLNGNLRLDIGRKSDQNIDGTITNAYIYIKRTISVISLLRQLITEMP